MSLETTPRSERKQWVMGGVGLIAVELFMLSLQPMPEQSAAITTYQEHLLGENGCLTDSVYDPNEGAELRAASIPDSTSEEVVLTVTPAHVTTHTPVLHLLLNEQSYAGETTYFSPSDYQTGGILFYECDYKTGY